MFGRDRDAVAAERTTSALVASTQGDSASAIRILEGVLLQFPHHAVGLYNLAANYQKQGHDEVARDAITKAVDIEPNYTLYLGVQIQMAVNSPARRQGAVLFEQLKQRYPHVGDHDLLGVHAYLRSGQPQLARATLGKARLPPHQVSDLESAVESALSARERLNEMGARLLGPIQDSDSLLQRLQELEEIYASASWGSQVQVNLGCTLRLTGDYLRAAQLIMGAAGGIEDKLAPYCWANAAYCLIAISEWKPAFQLLASAFVSLRAMYFPLEPAMVPGLATWALADGRVMESLHPSALKILGDAMADCPDKAMISPEITQMTALLRWPAAGLYASLDGPFTCNGIAAIFFARACDFRVSYSLRCVASSRMSWLNSSLSFRRTSTTACGAGTAGIRCTAAFTWYGRTANCSCSARPASLSVSVPRWHSEQQGTVVVRDASSRRQNDNFSSTTPLGFWSNSSKNICRWPHARRWLSL